MKLWENPRKRKWKGTPAQRAALKKGQAALAKWRKAQRQNDRYRSGNPRGKIPWYVGKLEDGDFEVIQTRHPLSQPWLAAYGPYTYDKALDVLEEKKGYVPISYMQRSPRTGQFIRRSKRSKHPNPRGKGKSMRKFKRCKPKVKKQLMRQSKRKLASRAAANICAKTMFHKRAKRNPKWARYAIQRGKAFFTGAGFAKAPRRAASYYDIEGAKQVAQRVADATGRPIRVVGIRG